LVLLLLLGCGLCDFYDEAPGQRRTRLDSVLIALPETVLRLRFSSDLADREMATAALNHIATGNSDTGTNTRCRRAFITFLGRVCGSHFPFLPALEYFCLWRQHFSFNFAYLIAVL